MKRVGQVVEARNDVVNRMHRSCTRTTTLFEDGSTSVSEAGVHETRDDACAVIVADGVQKVSGTMNLGKSKRKLVLVSCPEALTEEMAAQVKATFHMLDANEMGCLATADIRSLCSEIKGVEVPADTAMLILMAMDKTAARTVLELGDLLAYWPGINAYIDFCMKHGELKDAYTPFTAVDEYWVQKGRGRDEMLARQREADAAAAASGEVAEKPTVAPSPPAMGDGGKLFNHYEKALWKEVNLLRSDPTSYAGFLEREADALPYSDRRMAMLEAVAFLKKSHPVAPVKEVPLGLYLAAKMHACEQGRASGTRMGHMGVDGSLPSERISRYATWKSAVGENLSYGTVHPREVILGMLVDEYSSLRGRRENLFGAWSVCGIAVAKHRTHDWVVAMVFAGGCVSKRQDAKLKRACARAERENQALVGGGDAVQAAPPALKTPPLQRAKVKVYGRQTCGQSCAVYDALTAASVPFVKLDVDKDRSFFQVMSACGFRGGKFGLPVVVVHPNTAHWNITDPHALAADITGQMERESAMHGGEGKSTRTNDFVQTAVVRLYGREGEVNCGALARMLDDVGIKYDTMEVEHDESYFKALVASGFAGGEVALPVLVVDDTAHWSIPNLRALTLELSGQAPGEPAEKLEELLQPRFPALVVDTIVDLFKRHDTTGDGALNKDETQRLLEAIYAALGLQTGPDEISRCDIVELFRTYDLNRNARLSVKEFAEYLIGPKFAPLAATSRLHSAAAAKRSRSPTAAIMAAAGLSG